MLIKCRRNIDIANSVTVRHNDMFLITSADKAHYSHKRLKSCGIELIRLGACVRRDKGRKYFDTARASRKVPVLSRTDMVKKRLVVIMCNDTYFCDIRVYHIGKREVNKAVSASERHTCHCSVICKLGYRLVMYIRKD